MGPTLGMGDIQVPRILTLRCRYCNKAISLLRRLNDAEYCSDAHRFADAGEQELAMRRLAETQPANQRTQRVAAARTTQRTPGGQSAVATLDPYAGASMSLEGGALPFLPPPISAQKWTLASPDALHCAPILLFRDRDASLSAEMPLVSRLMRLPAGAPAASRLAAAVVGQLPQVRIVFPQSLVSRPSQRGKWASRPVTRLSSLTFLPLKSPCSHMGETAVLPAIAPKSPSRPRSRAVHSLAVVSTLRNLLPAMPPVGRFSATATPQAPLTAPAKVSFPISRLAPLSPPPVIDHSAELWDILDATPLAPPVPAAAYVQVSPIPPPSDPVRSPSRSLPIDFPGVPMAFGQRPRPAAVDLLPPGAVGQLALRASPSGAAPRAIQKSAPLALTCAARHRFPDRKSTKIAGALAQIWKVSPIPVPVPAAGRTSARWQSTWEFGSIPPRFRAPGIQAGKHSLPSAHGLAVPPPRQAGVVAVPHHSQHWFSAEITAARPAFTLNAVTGQPASEPTVFPVPRPKPAPFPHAARSLQTLQTVLRVRLPRRPGATATAFGAGSSNQRCVTLSPPAFAITGWRPDISPASDLCPAPAFPLPGKTVPSRVLRRLPVRLFQVPGAQPMARPLGGKPLAYPMGLWASRPLIRSPFIDFDDGKRRPSHLSPQQLGRKIRERLSAEGLSALWTRFTYLPSDLKWIAMVVPLIVGIWALARPSSPGPESNPQPIAREIETVADAPSEESKAAVASVTVARSAPPGSAVVAPAKLVPAAEPSRWDILTSRIAGRASVDFEEDFHNGLSLWEGKGEWARSWSYDRAGTVRPGQMAIFQPSVPLRDYVFEMKAAIDRRAIQWVVRASSPQNYHFARLNVTPGAPLTKLELERWSVVNGRTGRVTRLPLPHASANQTLFAIRVETRGDSVTTYLQDQVIDTFNDARLQDGGVGLLGAGDDRPRIYGIRVFHQNDFLGKLCSFLAPPPITSQGSE